MRLQNRTHEVTLSDGSSVRLSDFCNVIMHVKVPWGGTVYSDRGLQQEAEALITSILVVPDARVQVLRPDLGQVHFSYNDRQRFSAPVLSLMDRYHGLATLDGLKQRFQMMTRPVDVSGDWLADLGFDAVLQDPIHVRETMPLSLAHVRGAALDSDLALTVEIQALVKAPYAFRDSLADIFHWDVAP